MSGLDAIDRRLLAILQDDATVPIAELAERVGLTQTPCWKRVKRLQDTGLIAEWLETFEQAAALPAVVEFCRMSGEVDYLLKVLVKDIAAYDRFYRRLIAIAPLDDVSSSFAMEQIKFTTALPL